MNPIWTETNTFKINIVDRCPTDTISLVSGSSTFADYVYYINEHTDAMTYNSQVAYKYNSGGSGPLTHQRFYASWQTT